MKIFKILIIKQALEIFKLNKLFHGSEKEKRRYLSIFCAVIICVGICGIYWFRNIYQICMEFKSPQETLEFLINPLSLLVFFLIFFSAFLKASGVLYLDKSIDILFAYPIKNHYIVLAKLFFLYLWSAIISLILLIVPVLRYTIMRHDIMFGILDCVQIFILPIVPMLLGTILGYILYKYLRNIYKERIFIRSFLYLAIFLGFMVFMFFFFNNVDFSSLYGWIVVKVDITYLIGGIFFAHKIESVGVSIIALISGILLITYISRTYKSKCLNLQANPQKDGSLNLTFKKNKKLYSLWKREIKRYFSIPVYLINTMLGNILILLFVIYSCAKTGNVIVYFNLIGEMFGIENPIVLCSFAMSLMVILTNVTYAGISIEGKNREVLKSFPISIKELLTAKYLFHLSLTIPVICIATIVLGFTYDMNRFECFLCFILPASFSAFVGILGLFINLLLPNYEWENIIYIVKQSIPAIATICLSVLVGGSLLWCIIKLFGHSILIISYILSGILFALTFIMMQLIKQITKNF